MTTRTESETNPPALWGTVNGSRIDVLCVTGSIRMVNPKATAYRLIADLVGCAPARLPDLTPRQFHVSSWDDLVVYPSSTDIRESMMVVWENLGANTRCPDCELYASAVRFMNRDDLPDVVQCGVCGMSIEEEECL